MGLGDEILLRLGLDQSTLQSGMNKARLQVKGFAEETKASFGDIFKELAAPLTAVGVIAGVEKVFGKVEEIERVGAATGLTAEQFQKLAFAARQIGIDGGSMQAALIFLNKTLGEAGGTGPEAKEAQEKFQEFGISLRDASGHLKPTGALLDEISDKMAGMTDPAQRAEMAVQLLGRSGGQLIAILADGSKKLHERGANAAFLSDGDIESIKLAHEQIDQLTNSMTVFLGKSIAWFGFFKENGNFTIGFDALTHGKQHALNTLAFQQLDEEEKTRNSIADKKRAELYDAMKVAEREERIAEGKEVGVYNSKGALIPQTLTKKQLDKLWKDATENEIKIQTEIAKIRDKAAKDNDEVVKKYNLEQMQAKLATERATLTQLSILQKQNKDYYHTVSELAQNPSWMWNGQVAREIEWREKRLADYTLTNPIQWQETSQRWYSTRDKQWHGGETTIKTDEAFTRERDYIQSLKGQLEAAGYVSPELTMEKMETHLAQILEKLNTSNGLPVDPVLKQ